TRGLRRLASTAFGFPRSARFSVGFFLWIMTRLALQASDLEGCIDPLTHERAQPLVVGHFALNLGEVFRAHEVRAALAPPGVAELVVRTVPLGRVGLTAAGGIAADVVLLGERSRAQPPEGDDLTLEGIDVPLEDSGRGLGHGGGECSNETTGGRAEA